MKLGRQDRPLDPVLRARLHLRQGSGVSLGAIRGAMNSVDWISRALSGRPFFALKEIERLMRQSNGLEGDDLVRVILGMNGGTQIVAHGLEHVPIRGPVVIASTHNTGMFDFVAHAGALGALRPDLKVVANKEVEAFLGNDAIIPVKITRHNRAEAPTEVFEDMKRHLEQDGALLIFGSGRVPNQSEGLLVQSKWRTGASRISEICNAPIIPAAIDAKNSAYYYGLRKFAEVISGGNEHFGAMIGSLRYGAELLEKLGRQAHVHYGRQLDPGSPTEELKQAAEGLVPGLYA